MTDRPRSQHCRATVQHLLVCLPGCLPASSSFLSQTTPAGRYHLPNGPIRPGSRWVPSSPGERPGRIERMALRLRPYWHLRVMAGDLTWLVASALRQHQLPFNHLWLYQHGMFEIRSSIDILACS